MRFKLRNVWNEEYHMTQYMSKLQAEGYDVTKIDDERRPTYYIEVDNLEELLHGMFYECSECGNVQEFERNFCYECGADMRGEKNG